MNNSPPLIKLGELLLYSGILSAEQLNKAIESSQINKLPVGRVLIMDGILSEHILTSAVKLQSLVKDKLLEVNMAIEALKTIAVNNIDCDHALKMHGFQVMKTLPTARLGEILVESEITTSDKLTEALATSKDTGLPLGRIMVLTQKLSEELLTAALTTQVLIRDGKVSREQAIQGLKAARRRRVNIEQSLSEQGVYNPSGRPWVKLGELLVMANLVAETDLMTALELSLVKEIALGEVLVQTGYITLAVLEAALTLQEMVGNRTLSVHFASLCLKQIATRGVTVEQATAELGFVESSETGSFKLGEILKVCGIISEDDIKNAMMAALQNSKLLGEILINASCIDEKLLNACLRCQFLIRQGFINFEHAVVALNHCKQKSLTFDEALKDLGWIQPQTIIQKQA